MEDLRPSESTTEQVKVTCVPGHTGGGYVKLPLMAMVTTPVQTVEGRAVMSGIFLSGAKLFHAGTDICMVAIDNHDCLCHADICSCLNGFYIVIHSSARIVYAPIHSDV